MDALAPTDPTDRLAVPVVEVGPGPLTPAEVLAVARHDAPVRLSDEALAGLSPYQTEHINRFGNYVLDLSSPPAPLPFTLPERRPARRQTTAAGDV